jgi:hypothetical protein
LFACLCASYGVVRASDHDDGEPTSDLKGRAVNLTDHYAFRSPSDPSQLTLTMYFNPRSLPGYAYFMSTQSRYEIHVSRAASKTAKPTTKDDVLFRFEATDSPSSAGVQDVKLSVFKDGKSVGTDDGKTTSYAKSKANDITTNSVKIGDHTLQYFIGTRSDGFHFDVIRFFQVRAFLADRFFGGANGNGNPNAGLADNCRGDKFLANLLPGGVAENEAGGMSDGDVINLFNPPTCAPDFTKNYNVTAIVLNVPIAFLQKSGDQTLFDTWSTMSVPKL